MTSSRTSDDAIAHVVYRSRATRAFEPAMLPALVASAQQRNRRERLTGIVFHDRGRFLQWLEGAPAGLERVLGSIRRDRRHDQLEVLANGPAPRRMFGGCDMGLVPPPAAGGAVWGELWPMLGDALHQPQARAERAVARYASVGVMRGDVLAGLRSPTFDRRFAAALVDRLASLGAERDRARHRDLAHALIRQEPAAGRDMLTGELDRVGRRPGAVISLLEGVCSAMGDLWLSDDCSDGDITVLLAVLHAAFRRRAEGWQAMAQPIGLGLKLLVAPLPGERHLLPAVFQAEASALAGWQATIAFPDSLGELEALLKRHAFDVLCLSTSNVFRRDHRLSTLAETVAHARRASARTGLAVVVSGRLCHRHDVTASDVAADAGCAVSAKLREAVLAAIEAAARKSRDVEDLLWEGGSHRRRTGAPVIEQVATSAAGG